MHKIYFEDRCITICSPGDDILSDPNAVQFRVGTNINIHDFITLFEVSDSLKRIFITSENIDDTYRKICSEFKEVNAGGGLVSNRRGDYLLIRRYNLWDLPKGHQDDGEDIAETALREVMEETGIHDLELQNLICTTDHCYKRNDIWHLKHTWWFNMLHTDPTDLTPQKDEDISKAAWVAKSSLPPYLTNTFPSIWEVFKEARI